MTKRLKAVQINEKARQLQERGKFKDAARLYQDAIDADPTWGTPYYNLGLLYKKERNWKETLKCNRRATTLDADNDAAWWNLGIAATALAKWDVARAAWRGFGIEVADGDGPVDLPCGFGPIRINPHGDAEVVWAHRIDPARAVLANIPFPESKHRWRDVVLNDGAPNGYRKYQGKDVPVFDELQLLKPSEFGTYVARVRMPEGLAPSERLAEMAADMEGSAEDWSTSVRFICKACSEGRPHKQHDDEATPTDGVHIIGVAARSRQHASKILYAWQSAVPDTQVDALDLALETVPAN